MGESGVLGKRSSRKFRNVANPAGRRSETAFGDRTTAIAGVPNFEAKPQQEVARKGRNHKPSTPGNKRTRSSAGHAGRPDADSNHTIENKTATTAHRKQKSSPL
jgi:hypothetical protein